MAVIKLWLELDQLNLDAYTKTQVAGIIQTLLDQAQKEVDARKLKIQALILELAHSRRIRFGRSNESLPLFQSQWDLFEEIVQMDTAAVALANMNARIIWVLLTKKATFHVDHNTTAATAAVY